MLVNSYISYTQPSLVTLAPTTPLYLSGRLLVEVLTRIFSPANIFPASEPPVPLTD